MKLSRRGWNNVMIISILVFIALINAPSVLREHFNLGVEPEVTLPFILNSKWQPTALHFPKWSLEFDGSDWQSTRLLTLPPEQAINRWQSLQGTPVDNKTFEQLKPNLSAAHTIEVWYQEQEEPQRVTYYKTPQFWLFQNWNKQWLAVSVDEKYLFSFE